MPAECDFNLIGLQTLLCHPWEELQWFRLMIYLNVEVKAPWVTQESKAQITSRDRCSSLGVGSLGVPLSFGGAGTLRAFGEFA